MQEREVGEVPFSWQEALQRHEILLTNTGTANYWEIPHSADTQYLSHGYFRYIGKFPPQMAGFFVRELSQEGATVIDAMCGGGTTLTESALSGRNAIGFDVNPVSRIISRTVSSAVAPNELSIAAHKILNALSNSSHLFSEKIEEVRGELDLVDSEHFFDEKTKGDLAIALHVINSLPSDEVRNFMTTAVMSVLRQVSLVNVKKMNVVIDENKSNQKSLDEALSKKLAKMMQVNEEMSYRAMNPVRVVDHDATLPWPVESGSADLVVLHPPYLTNTAFSEFTRLQLALLGIEHKKVWKRELRNRGSYIHEPNGLKKYLVGWSRTIEHAFSALKKGGKCAIVVGDGRIEFVRIPIGTITQEFAKDAGFSVIHVAEHILNNNTGLTLTQKMKGQHVIILSK